MPPRPGVTGPCLCLDRYIPLWKYVRVVTPFEVLADPSRRRLLDLLRNGERSVNELVESLGASQPSVSKHLRVLREAGMVEVRQQAQQRLYRLRPGPLAEVDEWLVPYRTFWSDRLDALERRLDATPGDRHPDGSEGLDR